MYPFRGKPRVLEVSNFSSTRRRSDERFLLSPVPEAKTIEARLFALRSQRYSPPEALTDGLLRSLCPMLERSTRLPEKNIIIIIFTPELNQSESEKFWLNYFLDLVITSPEPPHLPSYSPAFSCVSPSCLRKLYFESLTRLREILILKLHEAFLNNWRDIATTTGDHACERVRWEDGWLIGRLSSTNRLSVRNYQSGLERWKPRERWRILRNKIRLNYMLFFYNKNIF